MTTTKLRRRLEVLEKGIGSSEPIALLMPDGRTETLPGHGIRADGVAARPETSFRYSLISCRTNVSSVGKRCAVTEGSGRCNRENISDTCPN